MRSADKLFNGTGAETLEDGVSLATPAFAAADTVLLGESTHGSLEFYLVRAAVTKLLIETHRFSGVIWEADWPSVGRVDRYVRGIGADREPEEALRDFERFPRWLWRNVIVCDFLRWLRRFNQGRAEAERVSIYGMDLFGLRASMQFVLEFLERKSPSGLQRAREAYAAVERHGGGVHKYGQAAIQGGQAAAGAEALKDVAAEVCRYSDDPLLFFAVQNARAVEGAERYYREAHLNPHRAWNAREEFMMDTLAAIRSELLRRGVAAKVVVWAHNSHVGDGRATAQGEGMRELTLGELCRGRPDISPVCVGLCTHGGYVTAAERWEGPYLQQALRPARAGSWEWLLHRQGRPFLMFDARCERSAAIWRTEMRLLRAVGALYKRERELRNHYSRSCLGRQFDFVMYFDRTSPLQPLDSPAHSRAGAPQTFPMGV